MNNSINLPSSASQTTNFNSVRSGLLYQPSNAESYYVSYGTSFNPSLEALTLTNGQQSLEPEKNKSYEAGAKWDLLHGNLSLSSAVFQVEKTNARTQISTGVFDLVGDIRVRGFELGAAGRIRPNWQVLAGYTRLDAKIVKASALDGTQGNVPANTPRDSASVWTTYNVTHDWEIGTGLTYMSPRYAAKQRRRQGAGLHPLGRHHRLPSAQVRHPAQPAQHHQPAELRIADPLRPRARGAEHRPHGAAHLHAEVLTACCCKCRRCWTRRN